jgi:hypothetical protein
MGIAGSSPADEPSIPSEYALQWRAPIGCPDAEEIRRRVARHHGAQSPGGPAARVDGEVQGDAHAGYVLRLTTEFEGQTHARRMHAPSCDELAEGTAIVIAVALRQGLALAMQPSEGPAPTVVPPMVPPIVPPRTRRHEPRRQWTRRASSRRASSRRVGPGPTRCCSSQGSSRRGPSVR